MSTLAFTNVTTTDATRTASSSRVIKGTAMAHISLYVNDATITVWNSYNIAAVDWYSSGTYRIQLIKPVRDRFKTLVLSAVTSTPGAGWQNGTRICHAVFYRSNYDIALGSVNSTTNAWLTSGNYSIAVYEE